MMQRSMSSSMQLAEASQAYMAASRVFDDACHSGSINKVIAADRLMLAAQTEVAKLRQGIANR